MIFAGGLAGGQFGVIVVGLDQTITVTSTTVDSFNMVQSLNYLGSNFGLFVGLAFYQFFEWILSFMTCLDKF